MRRLARRCASGEQEWVAWRVRVLQALQRNFGLQRIREVCNAFDFRTPTRGSIGLLFSSVHNYTSCPQFSNKLHQRTYRQCTYGQYNIAISARKPVCLRRGEVIARKVLDWPGSSAYYRCMSALFKSEFPPLLADGLHRMTLVALRQLCVTNFPASLSRPPIMQGLEFVIAMMGNLSIAGELWIDGSFLTEKIDPDDVDFSIRIDSSFCDNCTDEQTKAIEWPMSEEPKATCKCHTFPWFDYPSGHPFRSEGEYWKAYWLKQWGHSRTNEKKGIAVVQLPEDAK